ncbi:MAG: NAD(P)H-binding protein [Chloroflexota bacterium]|nr:NAD(P)H-binding protein [Chloroflexota bacterium]
MILITGATSFVGRAVVRRMASEQREVRCLLRPSRREQQLPTGVPFSIVSASMSDLPALRTAMQDVTAIVHLTGEEDIDHGGMLLSHVEDTANLITAAQEVGVHRFIYLSRLEADRASAYPILRVTGEVEAVVQESGLDYTILKTPIIYGPEDVYINVLVMLAKVIPFVFPIPDSGLSRFQPLWVADLTTCILTALCRDDLIGQTILLGGPEHFTFEQIVTEVLAAAGMHKRLIRVRMGLVQWAIALFDAFLPRNPTPSWWLDLLTVGGATDLMVIPRHFDFEPCRFTQCLDYLGQKRPWRRDLLHFVLGHL